MCGGVCRRHPFFFIKIYIFPRLHYACIKQRTKKYLSSVLTYPILSSHIITDIHITSLTHKNKKKERERERENAEANRTC
jgi:hypothetical protein